MAISKSGSISSRVKLTEGLNRAKAYAKEARDVVRTQAKSFGGVTSKARAQAKNAMSGYKAAAKKSGVNVSFENL